MDTSPSAVAGPLIAHRGACLDYPENTIAALVGARQAGCRWVEIDAQVALDRIPILMHDHSVDRTTDREGLVAMMTSSEITRLRTRAPRSGSYTDETVPLLADVLDACQKHDIALVLEVKATWGWDAEDAAVVADVVNERWPHDSASLIVTSFSAPAIAAFSKRVPWARSALATLAPPKNPATLMGDLGIDGFHLDYRYLRDGDIDRLRKAGAEVAVATVNDAAIGRRLLDAGVEGLITDNPTLL